MTDDSKWKLVKHYLEPIVPYLDDPDVTEVMINNYETVFIKKKGRIYPTETRFESARIVDTAIIQVGVAIGEDVSDDKHPILDAQLWDGSRFCGVLSPWSGYGSCITIRVFRKQSITIDDLLNFKSLNSEMLTYLEMAVKSSANILISGAVDSGKTTLLNTLTSYIPKHERLIVVEDTPEIVVNLDNKISLVVFERPTSKDYEKINLAKMIKTTLRMNPSRVIVGEIRDSEASLSFMRTLNIGTQGCMASIHANDPIDAIERMTDLLGERGIPVDYARKQVCSNLHVIVQAAQVKDERKIIEIAEVIGNGQLRTLFEYDFRERKHIKYDEAVDESKVKKSAYNHGLIN